MSEDLLGRTWCMAGSGKATVTIATGYKLDHSFHIDGKHVDTWDTPYLLRLKQSNGERMSDAWMPMAQQTVMPQAVQDMMVALWQLQLQADDTREERRDRGRQLKEERKQCECEEALAAQCEREDRDRVERREREDRETQEKRALAELETECERTRRAVELEAAEKLAVLEKERREAEALRKMNACCIPFIPSRRRRT